MTAKKTIVGCFIVLSVGCDGGRTTPQPDHKRTTQSNPNRMTVTDGDIPVERVYLLQKNDVVQFSLPNGESIKWIAASDTFGSAEQTTSSGLKAHSITPLLDSWHNYGVSTSSQHGVSIYAGVLDGYRVERAEDLRSNHALPIIIRISRSNSSAELEHATARATFDRQNANSSSSPPMRVPVGTVHHGLKKAFGIPIRLAVVDGQIEFDIFGDLDQASEAARLSKLTQMMSYVDSTLEGIDKIDQLSFNIMRDDRPLHRYDASRDAANIWTVTRTQ